MSFPPPLPGFTDPGQNILISHNGLDLALLNIQDLVLLNIQDPLLLNDQDLVPLDNKVLLVFKNLSEVLSHLLIEVFVVLTCGI